MKNFLFLGSTALQNIPSQLGPFGGFFRHCGYCLWNGWRNMCCKVKQRYVAAYVGKCTVLARGTDTAIVAGIFDSQQWLPDVSDWSQPNYDFPMKWMRLQNCCKFWHFLSTVPCEFGSISGLGCTSQCGSWKGRRRWTWSTKRVTIWHRPPFLLGDLRLANSSSLNELVL